MNPNGGPILEKYPERINWKCLSQNPNTLHLLFSFDYEKMETQNQGFAEELTRVVFCPDRLKRLSIIYNFDFKELVRIYLG
jgi:hypothetical protein